VPGTAGGATPFLSPDGRWLGFVRDSALIKVDLSGGTPQKIADVHRAFVLGASWADDGQIHFSLPAPDTEDIGARKHGIYRVSAQGGTPQLVSAADTSVEEGRVVPVVLPGARALLFISTRRNYVDNASAGGAAWSPAVGLGNVESRQRRMRCRGFAHNAPAGGRRTVDGSPAPLPRRPPRTGR
jgi:hypothetical protein